LVPIFGCASIPVVQTQVNVLEGFRSDASYHSFEDLNNLYETRSKVINRNCLKDAITKQDFNNLLSKGAKVITADNDWTLKIDYPWNYKGNSSNFILKGYCSGSQYIIEGKNNILKKIENIKDENQKLLSTKIYKGVSKWNEYEYTIEGEEGVYINEADENVLDYSLSYKNTEDFESINVLRMIKSYKSKYSDFEGIIFHIYLNNDNSFEMVVLNEYEEKQFNLNGTWFKNNSNEYVFNWENKDLFTVDSLTFQYLKLTSRK